VVAARPSTHAWSSLPGRLKHHSWCVTAHVREHLSQVIYVTRTILNPTPCSFWPLKYTLHGQLPSFFKTVSFIFNGFITLLDVALHGFSHANTEFLVSLLLIHCHSLNSHSFVGPSWEIPHVSTCYLFGYVMVCSVFANFPSIQPHQKKSHFKVQSSYSKPSSFVVSCDFHLLCVDFTLISN
jgi:hypothetical protein